MVIGQKNPSRTPSRRTNCHHRNQRHHPARPGRPRRTHHHRLPHQPQRTPPLQRPTVRTPTTTPARTCHPSTEAEPSPIIRDQTVHPASIRRDGSDRRSDLKRVHYLSILVARSTASEVFQAERRRGQSQNGMGGRPARSRSVSYMPQAQQMFQCGSASDQYPVRDVG